MRSGREFSAQMAAHVAAIPGRTALVYVCDQDARAAESLTYRQVHDAACRVGALLQSRLRPGERAVLMYPPGLPFAIGFLGCLYAGVVPVTVPVPDGQRRRSQRLSTIVHNAGVTALLTERSTVETVRQFAADLQLAELPCLATDVTDLPGPEHWRAPAPTPNRIAFLQYTSGSTSDPRGVAVTAANLADNAGVYQRVTGVGADARHGGWLPMHHDNGLIGLFLAPLYVGGTSVQMAASVFLRHPQSGYRLNGAKWLINNTTRADAICLLARTSPGGGARGYSLLFVDKRRLMPVRVHAGAVGISGQPERDALYIQCRSEHPDVEVVDAAADRTNRRVRQAKRLSGEIAAEFRVLAHDHVRPPVPGGDHDVARHPRSPSRDRRVGARGRTPPRFPWPTLARPRPPGGRDAALRGRPGRAVGNDRPPAWC
jgi:hypothetical protein